MKKVISKIYFSRCNSYG